jgi:signal transduction histidine kinase
MLLVARKSPAQKETIALGDLIDERTTLLREAADVRGVKLSRSGEGVAIASRVTVTRVLDNLLRNAIEASPSGGEVSVVVASGSDGTTLDVRDDGPGVAPERAGELFEPFFTMKPEGTGLGLWLSRSLLEIDAGTLAYARDGEHTHFRVTLPAPSDPPDADHPYR